jgi:hypothetical protein
MIFQLPYREIGIGISVILAVWAFYQAEERGRVIIAASAAVIFLIPVIFSSSLASLISFLGWILLGLSSFIYLRYHGHIPFR